MSVVVAVAALLLVNVSSSFATASEQSASGRAITGRMIVIPSDDALIEGTQARVSFRPPAGTSRLWVRLNDRLVSARFVRAGLLRVASFTTRDGLRHGTNTIYVLVTRGRKQPLVDSRSFVFGRRVPGLARLRVNLGAVSSVDLQVAAPKLTSAVFASGRRFNQALAVIRRDRRVRIWLNSRPVTGAFDTPGPTRWSASLSATQGLRHGVNRLRALVLEPETGRYDVLRRRFVVPDVPLPAAGRDISRPLGAGDQIRLDGRRSVNDGHGRLQYHWQVLSKPAGSNPKLLHASSATPLFDPDRSGRYRLGLRVTDRTRSPRAQASSSSTDVVDEVVGPSQMLVPFGGYGAINGQEGVTVGGVPYQVKDGAGDVFQWLTLDRSTLKPIKTGNSLIDPYGRHGYGGLDTLEKAIVHGGRGDLVVLTRRMAPPGAISSDQADQFNRILKLLGVGPIDADLLDRPYQQLVIVGVPYGGDGSGYYSQVFGPPVPQSPSKSVLKGWLMPDSVEAAPGIPNFRFQPEKVKFSTSDRNPDRINNLMKLGAYSLFGRRSSESSGGFQVVAIDPNTFEPVDVNHDNRSFVTNYAFNYGQTAADDAVADRQKMAQYLRDLANRKLLVAVQSIGTVSAAPPVDSTQQQKDALAQAWRDIDEAMQALGANPDIFFKADGSYAFIGGPMLDRSEDVDSSSAIETDPTRNPPVRESGTLQGFASVRSDGIMKPASADPSGSFDFKMYDIVFQSPTPWPHSDPNDPESVNYSRALAYVSTCLSEFDGWGPDLRSAYTGNLNLNYVAARTDLDKLPYPGTGPRNCTSWDYAKDPGFSPDQYSQLSAELDREFVWLDSIDRLFGAAQRALGRSGGQQLVDLKTIGDRLKDEIPPPSPAKEIGLSIGKFILGLFEVVGEVAESASGLAFVAAVTAVYELSTSIASAADTGEPLGDKIDKKVDDLAGAAADRLSASASGLDRLRQVIISDYGRLKALGTVANSPAYAIDTSTMAHAMSIAANGWFSTTLLPLLYGVHALHQRDIVKGEATTRNCYITLPAGYLFSKEPDSAQMKFYGDFNVNRYHGEFPTLFALGLHNLHDGPPYVPSDSLADSIFRPESQGGYGVQLARFMWEQYEHARGADASAPPTDIAICN